MLLKDGRVLDGDHVQMAGVAESPANIKITAGEVAVLPLLMFDDGLRRTFIHSGQVARMLDEAQTAAGQNPRLAGCGETGAGIGRMGRGRPLAQFDEFGRRTFEMQSSRRNAVGRAGHHRDHAHVHQGRRSQRSAAADRLGHADGHQQHAA